MIKNSTLFLTSALLIANNLFGALPSCKFAKLPETTDVIELKSKKNELSSVQITAVTQPDRKPEDVIRLVNMNNPANELFLLFRCDAGQSQLFRNATEKPARIACYSCEGNVQALTCPNLRFLEGDIEGQKPTIKPSASVNYTTKCKPVDCSKVVGLTKCERSDRSLTEKDNRDRLLGLVEAPAPKK